MHVARVTSFLILLFYTALSLLTLYLMIVSSVTHLGVSFSFSDLHWVPRDWAWANFREFFHLMHGSVWVWLRNSIMVALLPTMVNLILSAMAGYALAKIEFREGA